jgi:hypothetical protein
MKALLFSDNEFGINTAVALLNINKFTKGITLSQRLHD